MKIFTVISLITLFVFFACNRKPERPKLTLTEYSKQAVVTKGVIEKILAEPDYKKMHQIALAVESARAVSCTTVYEECNFFGQALNKIVNATQTGLPGAEDNVAIYRLVGEMDQAYVKGYKVLSEEWKVYRESHPEGPEAPEAK